jgi:hypothetical protein
MNRAQRAYTQALAIRLDITVASAARIVANLESLRLWMDDDEWEEFGRRCDEILTGAAAKGLTVEAYIDLASHLRSSASNLQIAQNLPISGDKPKDFGE